MDSENIILSSYPLSSQYLSALKTELVICPVYITLADLRVMSALQLFTTLRNIKARTLYIPLEDVNSVALLPILKLLAAITRCRQIDIVHPDMSVERVSRMEAVSGAFQFISASMASLAQAAVSWLQLKYLLGRARVTARADSVGKVLYLKTNLWFGIKAGGSVGHIAGVVNGLSAVGRDVVFASAEAPIMVAPTVEIICVKAPRAYGLPYELNNYRFQRNFSKLTESVLARGGFSFIYQRLSAANYLGVIESRRAGVPLVVEYNGSEVWVAKNWGRPLQFHRLAAMAEAAMLRHAHLIVTISDVLRDELIVKGIDRRRIVSYPNCVDPVVFSPDRFSIRDVAALRTTYGIRRDATVVGFVGTFGQWHGAEVLATAIKVLDERRPHWVSEHNLHFLLVGDGQKMADVRRILKDVDETLYTLAGLIPQDEAPLHLAAADILASPHVSNSDGSKFFGSPTKLFEYMAMGKGIVASQLDQIGEVLSPGIEAGHLAHGTPAEDSVAVLCRPGSVDDFLLGLEFLVRHSKWRDIMGANARSKALNQYTWSHHVSELLKGLDQVMALDHNGMQDSNGHG